MGSETRNANCDVSRSETRNATEGRALTLSMAAIDNIPCPFRA